MTSAELSELLRASRPVAPDSLRERVRAISAAAPAPRSTLRLRPAAPALIVPAARAATAVAAAALIAVVRPEHATNLNAAKQFSSASESAPAAAPSAPRSAEAAPRPTRPAAKSAASGDRELSRVRPRTRGDRRARRRLPGADRSRGQGRRRALERDRPGAANRPRPRRLCRLGPVRLVRRRASASLTLRVPTAKVQDAIAQLTALGKITSQQVQIQDLQEQLDQLSRQVAVLRGRIAHITALLANPDLTPERRAELQAQRDQLQSEPPRRPAAERGRLAGGSPGHDPADAGDEAGVDDAGAGLARPPHARRGRPDAHAGRAWHCSTGSSIVGPFALLGGVAWVGARMRRRSIESRLLARTPSLTECHRQALRSASSPTTRPRSGARARAP